MKRRALVFVCALIVVLVSQSTYAQTGDEFLAELQLYAATHARQEIAEYTRSRIALMSSDARTGVFTVSGVLLSDGITTPLTINGVLLSDNFVGPLTINGVLLSDSSTLRELCNSCRTAYNEDLVHSEELALQIFSDWDTNSIPEFLSDAAAALEAHVAGIVSAQEDRVACYESVFATLVG